MWNTCLNNIIFNILLVCSIQIIITKLFIQAIVGWFTLFHYKLIFCNRPLIVLFVTHLLIVSILACKLILSWMQKCSKAVELEHKYEQTQVRMCKKCRGVCDFVVAYELADRLQRAKCLKPLSFWMKKLCEI